jgi:O-antigen/teichoic acid export membrane protein
LVPATEPESTSRSALKEATLEGVRWVAFGRVAAEILAFGSGVVLAHLVPPHEFGRLAVTVIVSELALAFAAEGIGSPLVQRKTLRHEHLESAALLGLGLGLALTVLIFALAHPVAGAVFGSSTADLFQLLAPVCVLAGLRIVPQAVLQRRLDFRRLAAIEIAGVLTGVAVSVTLAATLGLDAEAYVLGMLAGGVISVALLMAATPVALPRWHRRELGEVLGFGAPAGVAGLSWVAVRNVDYAILGARLSPAQVGFYYRAFTLGAESEARISGIVARVAFPVYSRAQDPEHMRAVRARIIRLNATVVFPAMALFAALAPVLVPWMFGARWEPAVLPAQILAIAGLAVMINSGTGSLLLAAGRPRVLALYNVCLLVGYAATVFFTAPLGLTGVCIAVAGFQVGALIAAHVLLLKPLVGVDLRQLLGDLTPALTGSALTLLAAMPLTAALDGAGLPAPAVLALAGAAGATVYLLTVRLLFRSAWADVVLILRRLLRRGAEADAPPARSSREEVPSSVTSDPQLSTT